MHKKNKKLVAYRILLGISSAEMAEKIGICPSSYSQKETGKQPFKQNEMEKIAEVIREKYPTATVDDIFFDQEVFNTSTG
jgi:putative transcriptional regulator